MLNLHTQGKLCLKKKFYRYLSVASLSMASTLPLNHIVMAADETVQEAPRKSYSIPAGPLSKAISDYAAETGVRLTFDPSIAKDKQTKGLDGEYSVNEGFNRLLKDSGLEAIDDQDGGYFLVPALPTLGEGTLTLEKVDVRAQRFYEVGPLPGLGLTKEQIPGNVQSISAEEIKEARSLSMTDLFNSKLQGVTVNDYQGNPFQMDLQYRGFTAGPQIGTPQGLSVFMDGIRLNEPFGDVVNWDMIPMNAISAVDVFPGSNPIFGLNTLGGAFTMKTKDGFNNTETDIQVLKGSFGREQLMAESGWNNGTIAFFGAGSFFMEDGWREKSPSEVNQAFGKASYRGDRLDLHFSTLLVETDLVGNGLVPTQMYEQNRDGVFTSPDTTENSLQQFQLSGAYQVNDKFSITAQVYRRNSKRKQQGADVYTDFENQVARRNLNPGEQHTCLFTSTNDYKLPDYYLVPVQNGDFWSDPDLLNFAFTGSSQDAFANLPASYGQYLNAELPEYYLNTAQYGFNGPFNNFAQNAIFIPGADYTPPELDGEPTDYSGGQKSYIYAPQSNLATLKFESSFETVFMADQSFYFYTPDTAEYGDLTPGDGVGVKHMMLILPPTNADECQGDIGDDDLIITDSEGLAVTVDGAYYGETGTGYADGTPTAVFTNTTIDQVTDGASIQFNWNLDKHKFMVGASIDTPSAEYKSGQMLGMLDANRNAYLAPDEIRDQYAAASTEISNSNFSGDQVTKSIFASDTWSPVETLHITGALRYNETQGENKIAARSYGSRVWNLAQYVASPNNWYACSPGEDCPTGYIVPDASNLLNDAEKEDFSYYSLNPSLGAAWQATPDLNIYANWSQGTRVPSVIELGCAFDDTPMYLPDGSYRGPKSLIENRSCDLPTTLSGDPYLPQIKATSWDMGIRGRFNDNVEWNLGAYLTELKDDIYMIGFPGNRNFFDTIGDTRRQGLEAGITAAFDKWNFQLNYAMTEATFQNTFWMPANDNSSSVEDFYGNYDYSRMIEVKPGDRMPGVPLHNLNATVAYNVTPKWQVGLTAIAHSSSYVRGNENNKHQAGAVITDTVDMGGTPTKVNRKAALSNGEVPGYVTFNFQSTYSFNENLSINLLVNNIFDTEYFSAGSLGRNPFSPATYGATSQSGYNHNSLEWDTDNFVAPGAPRGGWVSLRWRF
ncbi:TonB-dependent receptor domain-containing protein [Methylophaga pinxianii]|uniref:TonB-dependent receptor domain-containing protein n=1 Tax=Methylophaga pinxianii TaxID=2881052 RepID=UPI001CF4C6E9|nr:TonB-dependent receptor [Methylophaga pinxianii]MCB2426943.1 TonB-dependent receptor [Methylophaga pinxianii]UPH44851.1 TonB-dependent receptor [Methylophaga pinxianii]